MASRRLVFLIPALLVMGLHTHAAENPAHADMAALCGSPAKIGAVWGGLNATAIRADMDHSFLEPAAEKGLEREELAARSGRFREISAKIAPHWLEEMTATGKAAGVDPDLYISYAANVYRALWAGEECTSYAAAPSATADGSVLFHKNRDNKDKPQAACIVASDAAQVNRFITVTDASVLACMMMVNEKGLAGSADTGGLKPATPRYRGMMNTFLLRHIAERAASCQDALDIINRFVDNGWYAGGGGTGTHWLFADRTGCILEVSNNSEEVSARRNSANVYISVRGRAAAVEALEKATGPISFGMFHRASRHPAMCFDTTISGMTVEIDPHDPANLTCAWIAFPAKGLAFPLFMGGRQTPLPLLDGTVYRLSKPFPGAESDAPIAFWDNAEAAAHERVAKFRNRLRHAGKPRGAAVPARFDAFTQSATEAHLAITEAAHAWLCPGDG